ncbi:MAG: hypothetical protein WCJ18_00245 [Planctomycetota bacterium]
MTQLSPQDYARGCLLRIVAQPGRYDQQTWQTVATADVTMPRSGIAEASCATTGCVAGTAAMLAGDVGIVRESDIRTIAGKSLYMIGSVTTKDGRRRGIRERGKELLGLSESDSSWLFSGDRKLPEVVNALIELSEGRPLSYKTSSAMTQQERDALKNYRVPPAVKRKSVPATPAAPVTVNATAHGRG